MTTAPRRAIFIAALSLYGAACSGEPPGPVVGGDRPVTLNTGGGGDERADHSLASGPLIRRAAASSRVRSEDRHDEKPVHEG